MQINDYIVYSNNVTSFNIENHDFIKGKEKNYVSTVCY